MTSPEKLLKFSGSNSKMKKLSTALGQKVYAFDLPAGHSCPAANECLSKAHKETGKITDGKDMKYRCYAASLEAAFTATRKLRWHNLDLLRTTSDIETLLTDSLPSDAEVIRVHSSGDFFNQKYLNAWLTVARKNPKITFYGYTKRADLFHGIQIPKNVNFIQSIGGKFDHIDAGLPTATVVDSFNKPYPVFDVDEKSELHIINGGGSFGLIIHGVQPPGGMKRDKTP